MLSYENRNAHVARHDVEKISADSITGRYAIISTSHIQHESERDISHKYKDY